jgi:intracellular septation protein
LSDRAIPAQAAPPHPLIHAGKFLIDDLLSTLLFVGIYAVSHDIYLATGIAIALGLGRIAYLRAKGVRIDVMQWLSLGLVIVFGGATLLTQNPVFVKLKPTFVYTAVAAVMLRPGWMNRYMPVLGRDRSADVALVFGYVWAAVMFATAVANLGVALFASTFVWTWFIFLFPLVSKILLILVQYLTTRTIVRRRIRAGQRLAMSAR